MTTENFSTRFQELDSWPSLDVLSAFYEGQLSAVAAVRSALPAIAEAAEEAARRLRQGGRLIYVGAGTSGRIGVQDGTELPPTFNWPEDKLVYLIAGGEGAIMKAVENAEDSVEEGIAGIRAAQVGPNDVVIGVAASGKTPFTIAALEEARSRGAQTIGISNNAGAPILAVCSHPILADTGEEVIAGSTRMKAGTAQKLVLNTLSTTVMIRLGHVFGNLMVDVQPLNAKLRRRIQQIVQEATGLDEQSVLSLLEEADGQAPVAIVMGLTGLSANKARQRLAANGGRIRPAIENI